MEAEDGATRTLPRGTRLTLTAPPQPVAGDPGTLLWWLAEADGFAGTVEAPETDLTPVRADATAGVAAEVAVLDHVDPVDALHSRLVLTAALAHAYDRADLAIHANVARASHGEGTTEILGGGDPSRPNQSFRLKQNPVTQRLAATESGVASTLEVRIDGVRWEELPDLYARDPKARVFATALTDAGETVIRFGDGISGARPTAGRDNIVADYSKGLGSGGNVRAGQLVLPLDRPLGLKDVTNPLPASGGADPEPAEEARRNAPIYTLTLGRVVSITDYRDFALGYPGIAKADARWIWDGETRRIVVTVAGAGGTALPPDGPTLPALLDAYREFGDPFVEFDLISYAPTAFRLALKVAVDPAYEQPAVLAAVEAALRAGFAFETRGFAQAVALSKIAAVAHAVPGVLAVDIDRLYREARPAGHPDPAPAPRRPDRPARPRRRAAAGRNPHPLGRSPRRARGDAMTRITPEALYALLPAVHRMRDADEGEPLRALLAVLAREGAVIEENIEQLLDDLFVETCDDWAAPYVGGIIGYRPLHPLGGLTTGPRAEVANTIGYRRRKGTAAVLEQLARDVTGWPARVVEYFQLVATCQHMNHVRPDHHWAPDLGDPLALEPLGQAFDAVTRTIDVRSITRAPGRKGVEGRHNLPNIGIFLWRLLPMRLDNAPTTRIDDRRHLFDPLGAPRQLVNRPEAEETITSLARAAQRPRRHHPPRAPRRPGPLVRPHRRRPRPRLRDHRRWRADPGRRHRGLRPVGRRGRLEPRATARPRRRARPRRPRARPHRLPRARGRRGPHHLPHRLPGPDRRRRLRPRRRPRAPHRRAPARHLPPPRPYHLAAGARRPPRRPAASSRSPPTTSSPPPPPSTPPPAPRSSSAPPTASARSSEPPPRSSSPAAPTPASPSTARSSKATRWRSPPTPTATPSPP